MAEAVFLFTERFFLISAMAGSFSASVSAAGPLRMAEKVESFLAASESYARCCGLGFLWFATYFLDALTAAAVALGFGEFLIAR